MADNIEVNGYALSRRWFDFSMENPDKIKPNHTALYFWIIETFNRFDWKEKVGLPTTHAMEVLGIKSYNTYISTLNDLIEFGVITMVERSKNQFTANIIALSKNNKAFDKAHVKATQKQRESTVQSTGESNCSITKPINHKTIKPINHKTIEERKINFSDTLKPFLEKYGREMVNDFYRYWTEPNKSNSKVRFELNKTWDVGRRLETWSRNDKNFKKPENGKSNSNPGKTAYKFDANRIIEANARQT